MGFPQIQAHLDACEAYRANKKENHKRQVGEDAATTRIKTNQKLDELDTRTKLQKTSDIHRPRIFQEQ